MADSLPGIHPSGSARIRIMLAICSLHQRGFPANYSNIQRELGLSSGSTTHNLRELERTGLVTRADRTSAFALTPSAVSDLLRDGWLTTSYAITIMLSTAGIELLEFAPESGEQQTSDDAPAPEGFDA